MLNLLPHLLRRRPANVDLLRERLQTFHDLVEKNNRVLELIAEAGEMLGGEYIFDIQYLRGLAQEAKAACHEVVDDLNAITNERYHQLLDTLNRLSAEIEAILGGRIVAPPSDYVVRLHKVDESMVDMVGAKMARLGTVRSRLNVLVPDGFVVTSYACQVFLEDNGIVDEVETAFAAPGPYDDEALAQRSASLRAKVLEAHVPRKMARAIERQTRTLVRKSGCSTLAVRSSALGEDGALSYAGQFRSVLGVPPDQVLDAYLQVIASMYSTEVMSYRQQSGLHPGRGLMAVGCLSMVPARAGGVMYTLDPTGQDPQSLEISATPGLGKTVVEGSAAADRFTVSRSTPHTVEERRIARKNNALLMNESGEIELVPVPEHAAEKSFVSDDELQRLAEIGLVIERHMKCAADIEWALSPDDAMTILQARPLKISAAPQRERFLVEVDESHPAIMREQGEIACSGVAAGPVVVVEDAGSLDVPDGAVLVARTSSPRLSVAIPHASAVITDVGTTTSHLATIAREYRVPTIVDTGNATELLAGVDVATVDADSKVVYAGRVDQLLHQHLLRSSSFEDTNEFRMLRRILLRVAPLNLRDPQARGFAAEACTTYHDIIRFAHEKAVQELTEGDWLEPSHSARCVHRLDLSVPLDLVLVDLGGGLDGACVGRKRVASENITSIPLRALIEGVTTEGVWETDPKSMDPNAFMASATRAPPWMTTVGSRPQSNLAIVSRQYLNLNLRLGFHFNIVDCFLGKSRNDNYIYFRFAGGVTELRRRANRATMLKRIFEEYDFVVETKGDLVTARVKKLSQEDMLTRLRMIGRLIGFTRQLDIVLSSEDTVNVYTERFLSGFFGKSEGHPTGQGDGRRI